MKTQIVEILTKFSLFQRKSSRSLGLHRLVQEVIRNRISIQETSSTLLTAVRILHQSFRDCPSPDQIPAGVTTSVTEQPSASVANPSSFYLWSKLASHASEIQQHLNVDFDIAGNPKLYHLIMECGIMASSMYLSKKLFCWAAFKDGKMLRIFTHEFPPVQKW